MYACIENGFVVEVCRVDPAAIFFPDYASKFIPCPDNVEAGWKYENGEFSLPQKTPDQIEAEIIEKAQQRLDGFAQTRGYDNILSACTYATSSVEKFRAEGQYCVTARDETWTKVHEMLPSYDESQLPVLAWPN